MPDIKLRDGSGVEQTYTGVDTITVPLADGSGTWTYGPPINFKTNNGKNLFSIDSVIFVEKLYKNNYIIKLFDLSNFKFKSEAILFLTSSATLSKSNSETSLILVIFHICLNIMNL